MFYKISILIIYSGFLISLNCFTFSSASIRTTKNQQVFGGITFKPQILEGRSAGDSDESETDSIYSIVRKPRSNSTSSITLNVHIIPSTAGVPSSIAAAGVEIDQDTKNNAIVESPNLEIEAKPIGTEIYPTLTSTTENPNYLNGYNSNGDFALAGDFNYGKITYGNMRDEMKTPQPQPQPPPSNFGYLFHRNYDQAGHFEGGGYNYGPGGSNQRINENYYQYDRPPPRPLPDYNYNQGRGNDYNYNMNHEKSNHFRTNSNSNSNHFRNNPNYETADRRVDSPIIEGSADEFYARRGYTKYFDNYRNGNRPSQSQSPYDDPPHKNDDYDPPHSWPAQPYDDYYPRKNCRTIC